MPGSLNQDRTEGQVTYQQCLHLRSLQLPYSTSVGRALDIKLESNKYSMVKTTIDLPETLLRRAKATAALQGRKLRELAQEGLERVLAQPNAPGAAGPSAFELMKDGCGVVESGVGDLSCNPQHLEGFGRE
jgi:hypothetical protein